MRYCFLVVVTVLLALVPAARAAEVEMVARGPWSAWKDGLRGRLMLAKGRRMLTPDHRETLVYVELQNQFGGKHGPKDVHFDPARVVCHAADSEGTELTPEKLTTGQSAFFEDRQPEAGWVTIPEAATLWLRVSPYCAGGIEGVELRLLVSDRSWTLTRQTHGHGFLSATLTVNSPGGHDRAQAWEGTLQLPKLQLVAAAYGPAEVAVEESLETEATATSPQEE